MSPQPPASAPPAPTNPPARGSPAPPESARASGLRYVSDQMAGITRKPAGAGFRYRDPDGRPLKDQAVLERINGLAIPPAWRDVWICPLPDGHLQATGRDARGRKQYRYHPDWRQQRDKTKFGRMAEFGKALPLIRQQVDHDLKLRGLPRERVLATVVCLLDQTMMRVGNVEYARANRSYGLTTLRDRHVEINGATIAFEFRGKGGKEHRIELKDGRLARIVRRCKDIPGYELFQYIDDQGQRQAIESADVNAYLKAITGQDWTAKDFRTWGATVLACMALGECPPGAAEAEARAHVARAVERVAEQLGNTPAICRKSYIHPQIISAYLAGTLPSLLKEQAVNDQHSGAGRLQDEELLVLDVLGGAAA